MNATDASTPRTDSGSGKLSEEFTVFCEAEFERRQNSGSAFDERAYREAMALVLDRLTQLEEEGRA